MKQININSLVKIELTPYGEYILLKHFVRTISLNKAISNLRFEDVYPIQDHKIQMELWRVMEIFGPFLHQGADKIPMKNLMIYVRDEDVKEVKDHE